MNKEITKKNARTKQDHHITEDRFLILINDEEHSFDYVIDKLVNVCDHTVEQATQCSLITHYKGKCDIKRGSMEKLRPLRISLSNHELKAIIS